MMQVPDGVRAAARLGLRLRAMGFRGGTPTGWARGRQLASQRGVSERDAAVMRAWFARHRFASYPSYAAWVRAGSPTGPGPWRRKGGVVAWLLWGGSTGKMWVNAPRV
jgi:hypothetical protein